MSSNVKNTRVLGVLSSLRSFFFCFCGSEQDLEPSTHKSRTMVLDGRYVDVLLQCKSLSGRFLRAAFSDGSDSQFNNVIILQGIQIRGQSESKVKLLKDESVVNI